MLPDDVEITTEAEFETALEDVLSAAVENDVTVDGAWDCQPTGTPHEREVLITKIEEPTASK